MERRFRPDRVDEKGLPTARWIMSDFAPNLQTCLMNLIDLEVLTPPPPLCEKTLCNGIMCSGTIRQIRENDVRFYRCGKKRCKAYHSLLDKTVFNNSKKGAHEIMIMVYYWLCGDSHSSIVSKTGYHPDTVTTWIRCFEELVHWDLTEGDDDRRIGGEGVIVHIDESKFGKRKYHRGHRVEGVWVVGGIETNTVDKKTFFLTVENRNAETLINIINNNVLEGSIVYTDMWRGYRDDDLAEIDIAHGTVNHSLHFVDPRTGIHTQNIEGVWSALKRTVSVRKRTERLIQGPLHLYMWKRYHRGNYWERFLSILSRYRLEEEDQEGMVQEEALNP